MKIWLCFVIMVCVCTVVERVQGEEQGKMISDLSLPSEIGGWKWDGKQVRYDPRTLFEYIDGAAELYLAYGFQALTVRRFEKSDQPPITLELYEMASSEDAFGAFTFERQEESAGIGQDSEFGGGLLRFWKGNYFVSVYAEGEGTEAESAILAVGRAAADSIPVTGREPMLVGLVPGKAFGLVDRSVFYLKSHVLLNQRFFVAHQNILNLSRRSEAVLAQYLQDRQKIQLLLIRYSDRKDATDAYESFMKVYLPDAGGKDHAKTEDQKWTMARQQNEFVLIVFGAPAAADAAALLQATAAKLPGGR